MKNIALFGSTGSIGTQTVDIIEKYPDKFRLVSCFANKNTEDILRQADRFNPEFIGLYDESAQRSLMEKYTGKAEIISPREHEKEIVSNSDIVVVAISGFAGIDITLSALECGKCVAIATKEVLVSAGEVVKDYIKKYGGKIIPIDSEHSALWQCLEGINKGGDYKSHVAKLILTASGGPFRTLDIKEFKNITVEQALRHPNWSMGAKITVDSATMMNKGLEVIEAERLYGVGADKIDILVHPQSIVHSMVECIDGNIIAQLGNADMRHPILYALSYPDRLPTRFGSLDLTTAHALTFEKPDTEKFPCISLAYKALKQGGIAPAVLNAANEKAVELFLNRKLSFIEISQFVQDKLMKLCDNNKNKTCTLEDIVKADRLARE